MRCVALALACSLALAGCAANSPPPRWYLLTPLAAAAETAPGADGSALAVGVGPVTLSAYLERSQIVTRDGGELRLAEFDRWAEPLEENVTRVLAENLSRLLATERVAVHPWRPAVPIDVRVSVEVVRFDLDPADGAVLTARFTVFDGDPGEHRVTRRSSYREPAAAGYAAGVAALSRTLDKLSRDVATVLASL